MAQDRWYIPIEITSSNNGFVVTEDPAGAATRYAVTVAAGTYYLYYASGGFTPGSSLYYAIRDALNTAGTANSYRFNADTPTSSTAQTNAGLTIDRASGSTSFRIDYNDASFTMDNRWFGQASAATNQTESGGEVTGPYTVLGTWTSYTLTDGTASDKHSWLRRNIEESSARTADAYQVEWNEDRIRRMVYEYVPAAHVYEGRIDAVDAAAYYSTGQLNVADNHNAFEQVWDAASRLGDLIIQFDDVSDLDPVNHQYGICRFNDRAQRESMENCTTITTRGGEFHRIDVELIQTAGVYGH